MTSHMASFPLASLLDNFAQVCTKIKISRFCNLHLAICPGLNANEIQIPYDKHCKVSSLVKSHQNNPGEGQVQGC